MIKFKILIIGFGSIGKRHYDILKTIKIVTDIKIISSTRVSKKVEKIKYEKNSILQYDPDYIIISSITSSHYAHLKFINSILKNKIILVEKPIFHKPKEIKKINNKIFVGYNLRFHPLISFLKKYLNNNLSDLLTVHVYAGSFLPNWRSKRSYTDIYSSKKNKGGGVELDLSHEIDYISWIFGKFRINYVLNNKISSLKIDSNDNLSILGTFNRRKYLYLHLNYYTKIEHRKIVIDFNSKSIHVDLIKNQLMIKFLNDKKPYQKEIKNFDRNKMYKDQHMSIMKKEFNNLCSMNDAIKYLVLLK